MAQQEVNQQQAAVGAGAAIKWRDGLLGWRTRSTQYAAAEPCIVAADLRLLPRELQACWPAAARAAAAARRLATGAQTVLAARSLRRRISRRSLLAQSKVQAPTKSRSEYS